MLIIALLVLGIFLVGGQSLKRHGGDRRRAAVDTSAWLLIAGAGLVATHWWPRNDLVLIAGLLIGLTAAGALRKVALS